MQIHNSFVILLILSRIQHAKVLKSEFFSFILDVAMKNTPIPEKLLCNNSKL